jgi:hypothetical protein
MKTRRLCSFVVFCLVLASSLPLAAGPRQPGNFGRDYVLNAQALSRWSLGGYFTTRDRDVLVTGRRVPTDMKNTAIMGYVGAEILPFLSAFVGLGESRTKFKPESHDDTGLCVAFGLQGNLLDHEIEDPALLEDRLRVNAELEYYFKEAEWRGRDLEWEELAASITLSIVNDIQGNKLYLPESLAVFGGPAYLDIQGSDVREASGDSFGYTLGLDIFYSKRISFFSRVEVFEETGYAGGVNVDF